MLATTSQKSLSSIRRSAFTLVEVMVVMAIIIILASLATVGTMKYLNNAKDLTDEARAMLIIKAYKTEHVVKYGGDGWPSEPSEVISYLEKGQADLLNPWGVPYQVSIQETPSGYAPYVSSQRPDGTFTFPKN
jgi:general secretion pathway protein G